MKKWIILICLVTSVSFSQSYFPLEVGNQWVFEGGYWFEDERDTNVVTVLADTLMPNGINYFELSSPIDEGGLEFKFVRCDSIGIYFYDKFDSTDELVYNFNAIKDEWYNVGYYAGGSDSPKVILYSENNFERFGYETTELNFGFDYLVPFSLSFSEKFGPVYSFVAHHEPYSESLIGCIISGVKYGTVVGVDEEEMIPMKLSLHQNYPNPFNLTTTIKFTTPPSPYQGEGSRVRLVVYDILGRKIVTLLNKPMQPGSYEVEFDGSNLTSGVYFYVLETGGKRLSKKMLFVK